MVSDELSDCSPKGNPSLAGKTILVTGSTSGAGLEAAALLAQRGARVLITGRNSERLETARRYVQEAAPTAIIHPGLLDLSSTADVRRFATDMLQRETRLDAIVNNAGVLAPAHELSADGLPLSVQVNYLAPFLLTFLLFPLLRASAPSRVLNISSLAILLGDIDLQRFAKPGEYSAFGHYCNAKLAAVISTEEMARRVNGTGVEIVSSDPGLSRSEFFRNLERTPAVQFLSKGLLAAGRPVKQTARSHVFVATDPRVISGVHYRDCKPFYSSWFAGDKSLAERLWQYTKMMANVTNVEDWESSLNNNYL